MEEPITPESIAAEITALLKDFDQITDKSSDLTKRTVALRFSTLHAKIAADPDLLTDKVWLSLDQRIRRPIFDVFGALVMTSLNSK